MQAMVRSLSAASPTAQFTRLAVGWVNEQPGRYATLTPSGAPRTIPSSSVVSV